MRISKTSLPEECGLCRRDPSCNPPECVCCDDAMTLARGQQPQIVFLTFDDAVGGQITPYYRRLFRPDRLNPNGCPISMTLFISHDNTNYDDVKEFFDKGMEVAVHSVSHSHLTPQTFAMEASDMKDNLVRAGVPADKITGWRSPFLEVEGDTQFSNLSSLGFTYDATLTVGARGRRFPKPFTLDHGWPFPCRVKDCPKGVHPRLWEVPVVELHASPSRPCVYVDACPIPWNNKQAAYDLLWKNFVNYYEGNRAPMGLNMHAAWFYDSERLAAMDDFITKLTSFKDVYIVNISQMLDWMRHPTSLSELIRGKLTTWNCDSALKPLHGMHNVSSQKQNISVQTKNIQNISQKQIPQTRLSNKNNAKHTSSTKQDLKSDLSEKPVLYETVHQQRQDNIQKHTSKESVAEKHQTNTTGNQSLVQPGVFDSKIIFTTEMSTSPIDEEETSYTKRNSSDATLLLKSRFGETIINDITPSAITIKSNSQSDRYNDAAGNSGTVNEISDQQVEWFGPTHQSKLVRRIPSNRHAINSSIDRQGVGGLHLVQLLKFENNTNTHKSKNQSISISGSDMVVGKFNYMPSNRKEIILSGDEHDIPTDGTSFSRSENYNVSYEVKPGVQFDRAWNYTTLWNGPIVPSLNKTGDLHDVPNLGQSSLILQPPVSDAKTHNKKGSHYLKVLWSRGLKDHKLPGNRTIVPITDQLTGVSKSAGTDKNGQRQQTLLPQEQDSLGSVHKLVAQFQESKINISVSPNNHTQTPIKETYNQSSMELEQAMKLILPANQSIDVLEMSRYVGDESVRNTTHDQLINIANKTSSTKTMHELGNHIKRLNNRIPITDGSTTNIYKNNLSTNSYDIYAYNHSLDVLFYFQKLKYLLYEKDQRRQQNAGLTHQRIKPKLPIHSTGMLVPEARKQGWWGVLYPQKHTATLQDFEFQLHRSLLLDPQSLPRLRKRPSQQYEPSRLRHSYSNERHTDSVYYFNRWLQEASLGLSANKVNRNLLMQLSPFRVHYTRPLFGSSNRQNVFKKPLFGPSNRQNVFTKTLFGPSNRQNVFTKPLFGPSNRQNVFTKPLFRSSTRQNVYTKPLFLTSNRQNVYTGPLFGKSNRQNVYTEPLFLTSNRQNVYTKPLFGTNNRQNVYTGPLFGKNNRQNVYNSLGKPIPRTHFQLSNSFSSRGSTGGLQRLYNSLMKLASPRY